MLVRMDKGFLENYFVNDSGTYQVILEENRLEMEMETECWVAEMESWL